MDRFQNLIELFESADYPVAVADRDMNILWQNEKAAGGEALPESMRRMIAEAVAGEGSGFVFRDAAMHSGRSITAAAMGEYIALVWSGYAGADPTFNADGVDAVMSAVRNGIHSIALAADAAELEDRDTRARAVESIKRGSYEVLRACEHMGIISRYYSGALEPKLTSVDVKELVYSLVEGAKSIINRRADITLMLPESPVPAMLDVKLTERAVLNLLLNAIVHGGADAAITVRLAAEAGRVVISVSDDGPGMDGEALMRATEPYFSAMPEGGGRYGSGMGLTVARICAGAHEGMLLLSSKEGKGTTANLVLPLGEPEGDMLRCTVGGYVANRFTNLYCELCSIAVMPG